MLNGWSRQQKLCLMALLCAVSMLFAGAQAEEALSPADYQDIVSTFSIDPDIPDYSEYLHKHGSDRPDAVLTLDAADYARYETADGGQEPLLLTDHAGMAGEALLLEESALAEFTFTAEQTGLYDLRMTYYP